MYICVCMRARVMAQLIVQLSTATVHYQENEILYIWYGFHATLKLACVFNPVFSLTRLSLWIEIGYVETFEQAWFKLQFH